MRFMYDSTTPWEIPRDAEMVAGYVDGRYAWPQEWWDMFPHAVHVRISAIGQRTAQVGDVEVGCIWPPENAVPWVLRARADGYDPTIYVNEMNDWGPCRAAFQRAGVPEPHWWVANYDGVVEIPAGSVAKQYAHPRDAGRAANAPLRAWETGKHYDASAVADYWPGVDGPEEDELSFDTYISNHYGGMVKAGEMLAYIDEHVNLVAAEQAAQRALLTELANDPDITVERFEQVVEKAVAAANAAHLAAQKAQLDATLTVVREIVGARDEDLAAEVVDEIGRRTARPEAA